MVGQISGGRGRGGRRSNLVVMVLMVELLLQHQVMMVLRHVRRRRGRTVRVTGVVRESERAEGAVGVVVSLGQRGRPRTPGGVPGSCPAVAFAGTHVAPRPRPSGCPAGRREGGSTDATRGGYRYE